MFLGEVAEIYFSFPERARQSENRNALWLTSACLQADNTIVNPIEDCALSSEKAIRVIPGDIVVKRIQPQFVNYISEGNMYYLGQNLALIRAKERIYNKYLAFIVENNIENFYKDMTGTTIPSIRRNGFEDFEIGDLPPLNEQRRIGELWWLLKEKRKYQQKLIEKEMLVLKAQLNNLLNK